MKCSIGCACKRHTAKKPKVSYEILASAYANGTTGPQVAEAFGISDATVCRAIQKFKVPPLDRYKGSRFKNTSGYTLVSLHPSDPLFGMARYFKKKGSTMYGLEHRVVMARHIGRVLTDSETVHHVNGNRSDNRLDNLQLRQGKHGNGVALACMDCGSHNIQAVEL